MRNLTIEAASLASARGFHTALAGFNVELELMPNELYLVRVAIQNDADVIRILRALEQHAERRRIS